MYSVPSEACPEDKAICDLANKGMDAQKLLRAAATFRRINLERLQSGKGKPIVESGLFKGALLYSGYIGSHLLPKIQGTYEKEVQDFLLKISFMFDRFLDVGCAEGYYLSGVVAWKNIPCMGIDVDVRSGDAVDYLAADVRYRDLVSFSTNLADALPFMTGRLACLVDVDGGEIKIIEQLDSMFSNSSSLQSVVLIVESSSAELGRENYPEIVSSLISRGWLFMSLLQQDPRERFVGSKSHMSFMDQFVDGWEGRPGAQSWVVAAKDF